MDLPSPDDISAILETPFVQSYWPLLLGGVVMIFLLFRGRGWLLLPAGVATGLAQAWHAGLFA
jgi:hypothetical protein